MHAQGKLSWQDSIGGGNEDLRCGPVVGGEHALFDELLRQRDASGRAQGERIVGGHDDVISAQSVEQNALAVGLG